MKYDERPPLEKDRDVLERQYGLSVTPATILNITWRVSEWLKPEYEEIHQRICGARVVYVDRYLYPRDDNDVARNVETAGAQSIGNASQELDQGMGKQLNTYYCPFLSL